MHEDDDWFEPGDSPGCLPAVVMGVFVIACVVVLGVVFYLGHRIGR
jgi:hypothetical protein